MLKLNVEEFNLIFLALEAYTNDNPAFEEGTPGDAIIEQLFSKLCDAQAAAEE